MAALRRWWPSASAIARQGTVESAPKARGPRDRTYRGYLMRENPWLQLQGGGASYPMAAVPSAASDYY